MSRLFHDNIISLIRVQITALVICTLPWHAFCTTVYANPTDTATSPTETVTQETFPTTQAPHQNIYSSGTVTGNNSGEQVNIDNLSVQQLQQQRDQLQAQANALQTTKDSYANTLDGLLKQKQNIESQIELKQREIDVNDKLIDGINTQIHATDESLMAQEQYILVLRQEILGRFNDLQSRMQVLAKGGGHTKLQIILSSDSYSSFLVNKKMTERLNTVDEETFNGLEEELAAIEIQRGLLKLQQAQFEEQKLTYEEAETALETSKNELLALLAEADSIADQLNKYISYYQQQYMTVRNEQTHLQLQINQITNEYDPGDLVAAEVMHWPAPDCTIITSSYKARWGRWHYGLDIASYGDSTGKSIVAAADGMVIFSGGDPSSGYGYYVMVDHGYDAGGRRIVTLYGHCSELYVQEGDAVFAGQTVLAAVGNTGNSNGAHLHFEVRVDGSAVDPVANGYINTAGIEIAG